MIVEKRGKLHDFTKRCSRAFEFDVKKKVFETQIVQFRNWLTSLLQAQLIKFIEI